MLTLTITGSLPGAADEFWPAIERAIGAFVGANDGRLTRIARPDGGANYRTFGRYDLTYRTATNEYTIRLEMN